MGPRRGNGRAARARRRAAVGSGDGEPQRTCVACRRVQPQRLLLRVRRTPDGLMELDPRREGGGRGGYLCPSEGCVAEALKRGRWAQVFRAPTVVPPETLERLRAWLAAGSRVVLAGRAERARGADGARPVGVPGKSAEGRS